MKNLKHFIWDFDGTVMNTYPNTTHCMQMALKDFGHDVEQVEILEKMMVNIPSSIEFYSNLFGIPELGERFWEYHNAKEEPVELFPLVKEVLKRVNDMGAANYIFTNRDGKIHELLLRAGIAEEFKEVVSSGDPEFVVKPAPDSIFYLMKKYGGTPEDTVMIGDRRCDLESGYNAGCKTIHLLTPAVPQYPECDWRIESFAEMLEQLK